MTHEYIKNVPESQRPDGKERLAPPASTLVETVRQVGTAAPTGWLVKGAKDIHGSHYQSLLYGLFFVLMGLGIDRAHEGNAAFALGLSAAFMFAGPFLSIGLYELSRQIQDVEPLDLVLSLFSWCRNPAAVGRFALYLSMVMVVWLWLSTLLLEALQQKPNLLYAGLLLLIWAVVAVAVFMASAMAIPMMLDRPVSAVQAVRASLQCFSLNTRPLCLWAAVVACMVGFSLALDYWPLLLLGPLLGHATWHAYRDMLADGDIPVAVDKATSIT